MPPHPHQQWPSKYPPSPPPPPSLSRYPLTPTLTHPPKPLYATPSPSSHRLYAPSPALLIPTHHLPQQSELNERSLDLQGYLRALEGATRGNGSPVEGKRNVQQVWSFGATDRVPGNVVGDDGWGFGGIGIGIVEEEGGEEEESGERMLGEGRRGRGMRVVNWHGDEDEEGQCHDRRRAEVVDREHRSLVQSLIGPPPPRPARPSRRSGDAGVVDVKALRQVERNLAALGF